MAGISSAAQALHPYRAFQTANVHPRDRFDYWHSVACKTLSAILQPACRQTFEAEIATGMLADIGLVLFANSPMDVARTMQHVARSEGDDLFICRQVACALALEQDSRQVILEGRRYNASRSALALHCQVLGRIKLLVTEEAPTGGIASERERWSRTL